MVKLFERFVERFGADKVAEKLGVAKSMVSMLKNGKRRPSLALAVRIAKVTRGGVPVHLWQEKTRGNPDPKSRRRARRAA